jgi:integrase
MLRPSEAAGTLWSEIDLNNNLWNVEANRMKKKKAFTVPLTEQAISLLQTMKSISHNSEFVFPSDRNLKKSINSSTVNMALKRMGYGGKLVAHGFRSVASTTMNDEGFDSVVIESALSHVGDNEVENAYNRSDYLERRKPLMEWWSKYIETAATGKTTVSSFKGLTAVN